MATTPQPDPSRADSAPDAGAPAQGLPEPPSCISASPEVSARRVGHDYLLRFPYDPEAVAILRNTRGASWFPAGRVWSMPAWRHEAVAKALERIEEVFARRREVEAEFTRHQAKFLGERAAGPIDRIAAPLPAEADLAPEPEAETVALDGMGF